MMDHIKFMKVVKKLVVDKLNNKVRWSHLSELSCPCRRNFYMSNVHFQSPPSHVHSCRLTRESTRWSENWHEKHKIWAVNFWQTATFLDSCCQCDVRWELPGQACVCACVLDLLSASLASVRKVRRAKSCAGNRIEMWRKTARLIFRPCMSCKPCTVALHCKKNATVKIWHR